MPPNLLAHYLYLWELTAVRQAVETAWISGSVRRTFIELLVPAGSSSSLGQAVVLAQRRAWPSVPWPHHHVALSRVSPRVRFCVPSTDTARPFPNTRRPSHLTETGLTHILMLAGANS